MNCYYFDFAKTQVFKKLIGNFTNFTFNNVSEVNDEIQKRLLVLLQSYI